MKILICGNYGAGNLGDELILKGLLKMLRNISDAHITVMSAHPVQTEKMHGVKSVHILPTGIRSILKGIFAFSTPKTWRAIRESDVILFGGGGLFNEDEPYSIYLWAIQARAFQRLNKKYIIIGQSFGPLTKPWSKKAVENTVNNAEEIFVRDQESQDFLYLLNIQKKIQVTTDPAFILEEQDFKSEEHEPSTLVILRKYKGIDEQDLRQKIMGVAKSSGEILELDVGEMAESLDYYWSLFKSAEMIFTMRLHAAILAILTERPFLAFNYNPKVENMMRKLELNELLLPISINADEIASKLSTPFPFEKMRTAKAKEHEIAEDQEKSLTRILKQL